MSRFYVKYLKRALDVVFSIAGIVLLSVPMLLIAILIKLDSRGSIIFKQKRSGRNHKPFYVLKFRTMPADAPRYAASIDLECETWRYSSFQIFLRKTSLDELPQLYNILMGDMSFIGPRPVIYEEKELLAERDRYGVNGIRPGLSGLAQINGRDRLDYREKAFFDGWYVKNIGFFLDVKIFFRSFIEASKCDGLN